MKCFYHSADLDGHCSGAIVKARFPDAQLYGINYGDPFPWQDIQRGEEVYMVDFSLQPFSEMVELSHLARLTWIDHHKSAIEEAQKHGFSCERRVVDTNFAACELCWRTLFAESPLPQAVFWLGRYDIWKHEEHPGALEFQYGMRMKRTDPSDSDNLPFWFAIFKDDEFAKKIRGEGALYLAYETEQNRKFAAAFAFETTLDGLRCIAVNKGFTNSLVFKSVYDPSKHDAMLSFAYRGGKWTVSLYADKPEVDVSVICKARGGGGHKGAAGFQCEELPFLQKA